MFWCIQSSQSKSLDIRNPLFSQAVQFGRLGQARKIQRIHSAFVTLELCNIPNQDMMLKKPKVM